MVFVPRYHDNNQHQKKGETVKATARKRAYKINIKAGKKAGTTFVVGGTRAGRFYSTALGNSQSRATQANRTTRAKTSHNLTARKVLAVCVLLLVVGSWLKINENNKPQAKAEPTAQTSEPSAWVYPISFESADPPKDYQEKQPEQVTKVSTTLSARASEYRDLFQKYFGKDYKIMMAICTSESGLIPTQEHQNSDKHKTLDVGICQINLYWHSDKVAGATSAEKIANLKNPETNIQIAKQIKDEWNGYNAWVCFNKGFYRKYLNI